MSEQKFPEVESLVIERVDGNLHLTGSADVLRIDPDSDPEFERSAEGRALRIRRLRRSAEIRVPANVSIEINHCGANVTLEDLVAPVLLDKVGGNLRAYRVGAITVLSSVGGNASFDRAGAIDARRIGGNFEADQVDGMVRVRNVGGKLEVRRAVSVDAEVVGGKARLEEIREAARLGSVSGKIAAVGIGGELVAESVGGHAYVTRVTGSVNLPNVGGAAELRAPFAPGSTWMVHSRGRISVELDRDSSLKLSASAGWGRVRIFGNDEAHLSRHGRSQVAGTLGVERPEAERTTMTLETSGADIIVGSGDEYSRHGNPWANFGRSFGAPFEDLASEITRDIPGFVGSILDATGRIVADSGGFARGVGGSVTRGVRDLLVEVARMLDELGDSIPHELAEQLAEKCRTISAIIRTAEDERRHASHEQRAEMRERIRAAARDLRETIREALRAARERSDSAESEAASTGTNVKPDDKAAQGQTRPFTAEARQRDILGILNRVKAGELEPDEADDMIAALMEIDATS